MPPPHRGLTGRADDAGRRLRDLLAYWPDDPAGFAGHCARVRDWGALFAAAERHGVLGLLHAPLVAEPGRVPPAARAELERRRALARVWDGHLLAALDEVLAAFTAVGLATAALKGPVLSERLYGEASLRRSTDLDLLVRPADLEAALGVLRSLGYTAESGASARYHRRHHHHLGLSQPRRPPLELHFRAYVGFGVALAAEEFLARARPYRTRLGGSCLVLAPEDELLYLCLHAAGHDFERLAWLYDLKAYLRLRPGPSWPAVFDRARAAGVAGAVAFTLEVLGRRLGVHDPEAERLAKRYGRRRPAARRWLALLDSLPRPSARAKLGSLALQALLCDRPASGVWFLQHHLLRVVRRRLQRQLPGLVPADWSA